MLSFIDVHRRKTSFSVNSETLWLQRSANWITASGVTLE